MYLFSTHAYSRRIFIRFYAPKTLQQMNAPYICLGWLSIRSVQHEPFIINSTINSTITLLNRVSYEFRWNGFSHDFVGSFKLVSE